MYADSYGGIRGGIHCADQRPSYSKLNVYVQPVLRPQFVSSSAAKLEQSMDIDVYFSSDYVYWILLCKCLFVIPWQNHVAFDLCALQVYTQTVALFPDLHSFQLLLCLSKSIHCSLHRRLHVVG